jgi:LacI family transcriptional regulator
MNDWDRQHGRRRPPTLKDVARLSGVSIATASKAINGRTDVHPETRRRVLEMANRISFTPNTLARGLLAGQTGTVGLLTNDLEGRFSIPILMGVEDAFGTGKMSGFLCDARGDSIRENYHLHALLARRVDGLIVVGNQTDPRPSLGPAVPVPVIYAYAPSVDPRDTSIVPDNTGAGAMAAQHLIAIGRRKIAHISGDGTHAAAIDRADGLLAALAEAGLSLAGDQVRYGRWSEAWGRAATSMLLDQQVDFDGLVCGSDTIARGALEILRGRGIEVPGSVAIVSFDNWEILVAESRPPLTSVDMNLKALGRLAAERLSQAINGERHAGIESLSCRLVVRGSSVAGA